MRAAAPLFGKHFLQLYTSRLAERHVPQVYTAGAVDVVSAEFDASQRFQFPPPANRVIYDFVWLREPANRVLSQFEHHLAQGRFDINQLEWEDMVKKLLNPDTCVDNEAEHCQSLSDPDKCLGGGFCGVIRNHQTHVLAGFRLYPRTVRETLLQDERALVCTAQRTVLDMAVVGITEYFNVSLCLLLHTMGWNNLFDECCGQGLSNGLQCNWLTDKLTINVRDARKESKVAATATHNYAAK